MFHREIFEALSKHLSARQVTVITGMRRVGKSTALQYLIEEWGSENVVYLDCERIEIRALFNTPNYEDIKEELELMGLDFSEKVLIAIDEIQLAENLPSVIKYLYDTYGVKFIVTGSSSYYIKNRFTESLSGRKRIFEMYPLSFKEFLVFKGYWKDLYEKYSWSDFNSAWFGLAQTWYEEYIRFGGFPEVVLETSEEDKIALLTDIINSYIELDVKLLSDFRVGEDLYKLIKLLSARTGSKVDYSKISSLTGINRNKVSKYIQLLEHTYFIYQISPFHRNIDKEISQQKKIYFSDTGILISLSENQLSSGQVFENAIAAQLVPHNKLNYYQRKSGQEIDFILNDKIAIEVKESPLESHLSTLNRRANSIHIAERKLIGRYFTQFNDFVWGGSVF